MNSIFLEFGTKMLISYFSIFSENGPRLTPLTLLNIKVFWYWIWFERKKLFVTYTYSFYRNITFYNLHVKLMHVTHMGPLIYFAEY